MSIRTRFNPLGTIGRKGLLPAGYIELEYLESTGTQWIDTGIYGTEHHGVDIKYQFANIALGQQASVFGYRTGVGGTGAYCVITANTFTFESNSYFYLSANGSTIKNGSINPTVLDSNVHIVQGNIGNDLAYKFDGTSLIGSPVPVATPFTHTLSTRIFSIYDQNRWLPGISRVYYCKMYDAGKLVRNFIPALDPTGRPCMFDTVSQQPFYNQGTEEFLCGYKLPSGYTALEYLESTGTQYITVPHTFINHSKFAAKLDMQAASNDFYGLMGFSGAAGQWFRVNSNRFEIGASVYTTAVNPFIRGKITQQIDRTGNTYTQNFQAGQESVSRELQLTEQPQSYGLFGTAMPYTAQAGYHYGSIRLFSAEIRVDDVLKQLLVPTKDASNRPCMYDLVTRKTYYNAGTGEFLYG